MERDRHIAGAGVGGVGVGGAVRRGGRRTGREATSTNINQLEKQERPGLKASQAGLVFPE